MQQVADFYPADLRALVAIMSAEGNGTPLTAGQLREHLSLSSGGASLVIDRLERAGHIRRARDDPADNRVVHLRYWSSASSSPPWPSRCVSMRKSSSTDPRPDRAGRGRAGSAN